MPNFGRITVGGNKKKTKIKNNCDGRREFSNLEHGFYCIESEGLSDKQKKKYNNCLHENDYFIVYWTKSCFYKNKACKVIGIYKKIEYFDITNQADYRKLTKNNTMKHIHNDEEEFELTCKKIEEGILRPFGVYLEKISDEELTKLPNTISKFGSLGNIADSQNKEYINNIINRQLQPQRQRQHPQPQPQRKVNPWSDYTGPRCKNGKPDKRTRSWKKYCKQP